MGPMENNDSIKTEFTLYSIFVEMVGLKKNTKTRSAWLENN